MSTMLRSTVIVIGLIAAGVIITARPPVLADDKEDAKLAQRLETLTERVQAMERAVGSRAADSSLPSLSERLAMLEKGLRDLAGAAGKAKWSTPESNVNELRRSITTGERERTALRDRLTALERSSREVTDCARELRSVSTTLDSLQRDLRALESRVSRLESRP
jgi:chromosome segregation ATPase